ncbi:precorrin-6A reductase [Motiliproteus sp. MSK22-1]|uniref:precorrin-6A reductase n=1 Tax=Motiliproteus sp. MSK22-1 TaxID=1897630 RepID=UPI000978824D|nr:precorrin-6A reductase [Motiliproteus sp. MSK22-1]OMH33559.1 precorrin-6x reductase [Motiliproteus sp. MSK22-1]
MKVLLLGGTADGRHVAQALHQQGLSVIYSVAGLVRMPNVPCPVISGGFSQWGGLQQYIEQESIDLILDVTHPFAETMSTTAVKVANKCGIPCWRFHRKAWEQQAGDNWQGFTEWKPLLKALAGKQSIFVTAGQLTQELMDQLVQDSSIQKVLYRTAAPAKINLPDTVQWIKAIGPFDLQGEQALMKEHKVDALVTKNSGGDSTQAKLVAARQLGIPVFMFQRPELPRADLEFEALSECIDKVIDRCRFGA